MSAEKRRRVPITTIIVTLVGAGVGVVGLIMLLLGIGGTSPTTVQVPGINLNVSTASLALVVMVVGFGVAVSTFGLRVAYAKGQSVEKRRALEALLKARPDLDVKELFELVEKVETEAMAPDKYNI